MGEKIEKLFFYTLIFSIPFQTRVILRSWGIGFSEWNTAFLYWTDLLIFALLGLWFLRQSHFYDISRKSDSQKKSVFSRYDWFLIGFLVISAISIKNAFNQPLGFYQLLKLAEFSLLYFYVKSNLGQIFNLATSFFVFLASGIFQAILSILQYVRQSDLGLRFLGETVLNPDLFNVAIFLVNGERILRAYGTTPHPNVLAFFLFVAIFIFYFYCFVCRGTPRQLQNNNPAPFGDELLDDKNIKADRRDILKTKQEKKNSDPEWCWGTSSIGLSIYTILLFGFFFTFSRIIIFIWFVGLIYRFGWLYWKKEFRGIIQRTDVKKLVLATFVLIFVFSLLFWPEVLARLKISPQEEAVTLRGFYNEVALQEKPFLGIGPGNFVNWFKEKNPGLAQNLYQPVHNIYLLIFSETGILGLAAFLLFLFFLIKSYLKQTSFNRPFHYSLFIILFSLLFFGLFDHFLWTLQQGQIIFWLVLGLVAALPKRVSIA